MTASIKIEVYKSQKDAKNRAGYLDQKGFDSTVTSYRDAAWENKLDDADPIRYPDIASKSDGSEVWVLIATK